MSALLISNFFMKSEPLLPQKKEFREINFLRGLAISGIVCIHIDSYFAFYRPSDEFRIITLSISNLSRFSVPIFILSSGYLLRIGTSFWKNKLVHLFLPYILISIPGYFAKTQEFNRDAMDYLLKLVTGRILEPYYFVPLLAGYYLIFWTFHRNFFSLSTMNKFGIVILSLFIQLISNYHFPTFLASYRSFFPTEYIFYFFVGMFLREVSLKKNYLQKFFLLNTFLISMITVFVLIYTLETYQALPNNLFFLPLGIWLLFLPRPDLKFYPELLNHRSVFLRFIMKSFETIGRYSLSIFLIHPLIIHYMHSFDPHILGGRTISYFLTWTINIALPLIIHRTIYLSIEGIQSIREKNLDQ
ncbi:MAG: acyltransferase [Leptospiraceae bacterium]|nr:acyltransferase [Leptospiraceae bacterium]MCP5511083.1 acyltransferase [Leptospiraceae bacterium]